jgi:hypothetical protein
VWLGDSLYLDFLSAESAKECTQKTQKIQGIHRGKFEELEIAVKRKSVDENCIYSAAFACIFLRFLRFGFLAHCKAFSSNQRAMRHKESYLAT